MQRFPNTVDGLIELLDRTFPEAVPSPGQSNDEIFHTAGQRSVVNWLKERRARALQNSINPPARRKRGQGRHVSGKETKD